MFVEILLNIEGLPSKDIFLSELIFQVFFLSNEMYFSIELMYIFFIYKFIVLLSTWPPNSLYITGKM